MGSSPTQSWASHSRYSPMKGHWSADIRFSACLGGEFQLGAERGHVGMLDDPTRPPRHEYRQRFGAGPSLQGAGLSRTRPSFVCPAVSVVTTRPDLHLSSAALTLHSLAARDRDKGLLPHRAVRCRFRRGSLIQSADGGHRAVQQAKAFRRNVWHSRKTSICHR